MFIRRSPDGSQKQIHLEQLYSSPNGSACWIIGGGPSLTRGYAEQILETPTPRFTINLAGSGLLRPHFWTSYDPTCRFHRSLYLDPSVMKFVHAGKAMNVIPETNFKVCEAPSLFLLERNRKVGFDDFLADGLCGTGKVTDWQDSLIQAIDIAYRLGFRRLFLVGTNMCIQPSRSLRAAAANRGVSYRPLERLGDFCKRCYQAGLSWDEIEKMTTARQYHFPETKSLKSAISTDFHYFRIANYLRLSRSALKRAGLELISVTAQSRLNFFFEHRSLKSVCRLLKHETGDPFRESTLGKYTFRKDALPKKCYLTQDFTPHFWSKAGSEEKSIPGSHEIPATRKVLNNPQASQRRIGERRLVMPAEVKVCIEEEG